MSSSKLRKSCAGGEDESKIDMSPMIDMVFLLLIFFIVNATAIVVKTDPEVKPPIAPNGRSPIPDVGKIVVNVRADGTYTAENLSVLTGEEAIRAYIKEKRDEFERQAKTPQLHLRGDKESLFKHGRAVVRAAAQAEVEQVIFAAMTRER